MKDGPHRVLCSCGWEITAPTEEEVKRLADEHQAAEHAEEDEEIEWEWIN